MELITTRERTRRIWTLIVSGVFLVTALGFFTYAMTTIDDLTNAPKGQDEEGNIIESIESVSAEIREIPPRIEAIRENMRKFSDPWGWTRYSTDSASPNQQTFDPGNPAGHVPDALKRFVDLWYARHWGGKPFGGLFGKFTTEPYAEEKEEEVEKDGRKVKEKRWVPRGSAKPIPDIIKAAYEEAREYHNTSDALIRESLKDWEEEKKLRAEVRQKDRDKGKDIPEQIAQLQRLMEQARKQEADQFAELTNLEAELQKVREERDVKMKEFAEKEKQEEVKIEALRARIRKLQVVIQNAEFKEEPDGQILHVYPDETVRTTLTNRDRVFNFYRFGVYSVEKGGERVKKGEIEIQELYDDYSLAIVLWVKRGETIKPGDFIWNPRYEKELKNHFVVAGRLTRFSREEVKYKLYEIGDVYQPKIDENTNYCICGDEYWNDPTYHEALRRGLRIYAERYLYWYLVFDRPIEPIEALPADR